MKLGNLFDSSKNKRQSSLINTKPRNSNKNKRYTVGGNTNGIQIGPIDNINVFSQWFTMNDKAIMCLQTKSNTNNNPLYGSNEKKVNIF